MSEITTPSFEYKDNLTLALKYLDDNEMDVPIRLRMRVKALTAKAEGSLTSILKTYHDTITDALITYFEGGTVVGPRNKFRIGASESFYDAFYLGWQDGGNKPPIDAEALEWLNARLAQELGYIDSLFVQIKDLRGDKDFDWFKWVTERADGYTQAVKDVYNYAKLYAMRNRMLTFTGSDGQGNHICQSIGGTCVRLKGQRHKASWWLSHDLMPYRGNQNYDCGGWNCQHYLEDDNGERVTQ